MNYHLFKVLFCILLCTIFSPFFLVMASPFSNQSYQLPSNNNTPASNQFFGTVRFEGMSYFSNLEGEESLNRQQYLSTRLGLVGLSYDTRWGYGTDFQAGKYNYGVSNYSVQEAFLFYRPESYFKITVGRKKVDWSILDNYWRLALWQPKYAIDYLRPEEQGLTGAFLNYKRSDFQFIAFTTPMFIPNIGVDVREEGGELKSDSRWFKKPTSKYDFNGRIRNISYNLTVPEIQNLASKPGAGLNMQIGDSSRGLWLNQSVGYKPVNDLLLKREGYAEAAESTVKVIVSPDVTYHSIVSLDAGYSFDNFKVVSSYIEDSPKEKTPGDDWVIQKLEGVKGYSLMIENNRDYSAIKHLNIQLGYLKLFGGKIQDINSKSEADDFTLFDERFLFTNSVLFKVEGRLFKIFDRDFVTKISYLRDYDQMGSLVNTEFQFFPWVNWAILFGGDFISVDTENQDSTFLNQYRANDRIYGGITYVF